MHNATRTTIIFVLCFQQTVFQNGDSILLFHRAHSDPIIPDSNLVIGNDTDHYYSGNLSGKIPEKVPGKGSGKDSRSEGEVLDSC